MRVFVAGGSGTMGRPLVRALRAAGHEVIASTRTPGKQGEFVLMDAFDRTRVHAVLAAAKPDVVIHQLTALPAGGPRTAADLETTNRLRIEGTAHLVDAAIAAGARRFIVGSFALLAPRQSKPAASSDAAVNAIELMEHQAVAAAAVSGMTTAVLRYGMFYGPGVPATHALSDLVCKRRLPVLRHDRSLLPFIHIDDAVTATVAAVTRGRGDVPYEIVDDEPVSFRTMIETLADVMRAPAPWRVPGWLLQLAAPYLSQLLSNRLALSNAEARRALQWRPRFRGVREGLLATLQGSCRSGGHAGHRQGIAA